MTVTTVTVEMTVATMTMDSPQNKTSSSDRDILFDASLSLFDRSRAHAEHGQRNIIVPETPEALRPTQQQLEKAWEDSSRALALLK